MFNCLDVVHMCRNREINYKLDVDGIVEKHSSIGMRSGEQGGIWLMLLFPQSDLLLILHGGL